MKYYNRILLLAMVAGITVSCADALFADYKTEKPESLKKYEYLNEYGDLKTYIDRISHPDFKLGTGVTVSDFLKQDLVYTLTVNNYDDVTAGNAMKYSSCVDAKGNMDFGTVKKFVKTAKETGISIYGHTLCWHSQQQNAYLNGLIADKEPEPVPGSSEIALHIKTSKPQANVWDWELYYDLDEALIANQEYTISVRMKASSAITFPFWPGKKDGTDTQYGAGTFSAGEQWSTNTFTFTPSADIEKLKSLIHWIERWESDGETKVDGIGTQMHVSYYMNPATQASKENAIINMFTLLASTGKLIKITELDMVIVDAAGETILTENLTDEMQQNMSDFYQFIIEKYFEIIPVAQQYGITHWSPTDSPSENSFWRKGQPIGLWDLNYNRKPVYVGFLEGLRNGTASK